MDIYGIVLRASKDARRTGAIRSLSSRVGFQRVGRQAGRQRHAHPTRIPLTHPSLHFVSFHLARARLVSGGDQGPGHSAAVSPSPCLHALALSFNQVHRR